MQRVGDRYEKTRRQLQIGIAVSLASAASRCCCTVEESLCESHFCDSFVLAQFRRLIGPTNVLLLYAKQVGLRGKLANFTNSTKCLYCQIQMIPSDSENAQSQESMTFDCLTDANGEAGIFSEIPYEIDLPRDFVEITLDIVAKRSVDLVCSWWASTPLSKLNSPRSNRLSQRLRDSADPQLSGPRKSKHLVVRISGTTESPEESVEQLAGAVFGLGSQALETSMRAQYQHCLFSRLDFTPA